MFGGLKSCLSSKKPFGLPSQGIAKKESNPLFRLGKFGLQKPCFRNPKRVSTAFEIGKYD